MAARMYVIILRNGFEFVSEGYDTLELIFLHFAQNIGADFEYLLGSKVLITLYSPQQVANKRN